MRAASISLPALLGAILMTIVAVTDPEPRTDSSVASETRIAAVEVPQVWTYAIPRFAADLEGDLSPVGDTSGDRVYDFPAWEPAEIVDDVIGETQTLEPVRTPLPVISSTSVYALSEGEMRDVLAAAGWPVELHNAALRVAWCESNYRPGAVGDHGLALGLFQIHIRSSWQGWWEAFGFDQTRYAEPVYNAQLAWRIYQYEQERGYPPFANWSCKP